MKIKHTVYPGCLYRRNMRTMFDKFLYNCTLHHTVGKATKKFIADHLLIIGLAQFS